MAGPVRRLDGRSAHRTADCRGDAGHSETYPAAVLAAWGLGKAKQSWSELQSNFAFLTRGVGDPAFEAAQGFQRLLAGGQLAPVVGAAWGVESDLPREGPARMAPHARTDERTGPAQASNLGEDTARRVAR